MKNSITFINDDLRYNIQITEQEINKCSKIREKLKDHKYIIQSNVQNETLKSFLHYIKKEIIPDVNHNNIGEYTQLLNEFGIENEPYFNLLFLKFYNENTSKIDKSLIERNISRQLDFYIKKYPKNLRQVGITSLVNIFCHKERVLKDQDSAYLFIINAANKQSSDIYVLVSNLDGNEMTKKYLFDSIANKEKHFDFIPKNSKNLIFFYDENLKKSIKENNDLKLKQQKMQTVIDSKEKSLAENKKQMIILEKQVNDLNIKLRNSETKNKNLKKFESNCTKVLKKQQSKTNQTNHCKMQNTNSEEITIAQTIIFFALFSIFFRYVVFSVVRSIFNIIISSSLWFKLKLIFILDHFMSGIILFFLFTPFLEPNSKCIFISLSLIILEILYLLMPDNLIMQNLFINTLHKKIFSKTAWFWKRKENISLE